MSNDLATFSSHPAARDTFDLMVFRKTYSCGQYGEEPSEATVEAGVLKVPSAFVAFLDWLQSTDGQGRYLRVEDSHFDCPDLFASVGAPEVDDAAWSQDLYQLLCFGEFSRSPNSPLFTMRIDVYTE
jgi:hypothetical protein